MAMEQIRKQIENLFREYWMDDEEYNEYIELVLKASNSSWEILNNQIQQGIENGYSIEQQFDIIKNIITT